MITRENIIDTLRQRLEPLPCVHALWLEGADAGGFADEYSDLDFWADVADDQIQPAIKAVEDTLAALAPINSRHVLPHAHPKIRQHVYHLAGTPDTLLIDFCWQLHSRPAAESILLEDDPIEAAAVLFDKAGVLRTRPWDPAELAPVHRALLADCRYRMSQQARVRKYLCRGLYPEALGAYQHYVLQPLVAALRILYTPAHTEYGLTHLSLHLPAEALERLDPFLRVASLEGIAALLPPATAWFSELEARLSHLG